MSEILWRSVVIGIGATALMDVWALFLHAAIGQPLPNWGFVGRWVWHLRRGKVFHDDIAAAEPFASEMALGWVFHYAVGIAYALILVAIVGTDWLVAPRFLPAWIWGLVTVGAGWFLLAPGLGAGWALAKTPNPGKGRLLNLIAHTVFALGLYGTALVLA